MTTFKEIFEFSKNPPPGCCSAAPVNGDKLTWQCKIQGPDKSPYSGGVFVVLIQLPHSYPFKPPLVTFQTKIFHANIPEHTWVPCTDHLWYEYLPVYTMSKVIQRILEMLTTPILRCEFRLEARKLYDRNRTQYNKTAAEWTRKYAM